jgi:uncharacterized protein
VKFWHTSAVVALLLDQDATVAAREVLRADRAMVAWWGTPVECASAAARRRREGRLMPVQESEVLALLGRLRESWYEVQHSTLLRSEAMRLVRIHSLRAADAFQLAAARLWAGAPTDAALVTFDERLALTARLEGFRVLP